MEKAKVLDTEFTPLKAENNISLVFGIPLHLIASPALSLPPLLSLLVGERQ
jgi:hypothetical protein